MKKWLIVSSVFTFVFFFAWLFQYKQVLWDTSRPINAELFSYYGGFLSSIFGVISIVFIYLTFKQTQKTQEVTDKTLDETRKGSIETTFFNLFQAHQNLVTHLHNRITNEFIQHYVTSMEKTGRSIDMNKSHNDFFELMYGILDARYYGENHDYNRQNITNFFIDYDWVMGHYFRSIHHLVSWIDRTAFLNQEEKNFYIAYLSSYLSNDELRLIFYYTISRRNQSDVCVLFEKYRFFDSVDATLINKGKNNDVEYYNSILHPDLDQ